MLKVLEACLCVHTVANVLLCSSQATYHMIVCWTFNVKLISQGDTEYDPPQKKSIVKMQNMNFGK